MPLTDDATDPVLEVDGLCAGYGEAQVVRDVSLAVRPGEVVTLVGRNGAGKTTILRTLMGLHPNTSGTVRFRGADIGGLGPHKRTRRGLGWVQDDRGIYATLSVKENLLLPPVVDRDTAWSTGEIYETFPILEQRGGFRGTALSGGEQQMLALARPLRMGSRLLLLDEPSEGLAPVIVDQIRDIILRIKAAGVAVLLVEQNVEFATSVADRHYLIAQGQVVQSLANSEFKGRLSELLEHLGM